VTAEIRRLLDDWVKREAHYRELSRERNHEGNQVMDAYYDGKRMAMADCRSDLAALLAAPAPHPEEPRFLAALRRKAERDGIPLAQLLRDSRARALDTPDPENLAAPAPAQEDEHGDWLDEQPFYELMQAYRHAPDTQQGTVVYAYEAVKRVIRQHTP